MAILTLLKPIVDSLGVSIFAVKCIINHRFETKSFRIEHVKHFSTSGAKSDLKMTPKWVDFGPILGLSFLSLFSKRLCLDTAGRKPASKSGPKMGHFWVILGVQLYDTFWR